MGARPVVPNRLHSIPNRERHLPMKKTATSSFASVLTKLMEDAGIGVSELSRRSGVSRPYLSDLTRGVKKDAGWETVMRLADGLAVSTEALRYRPGPQASPRASRPRRATG